jgi:Ca2+/H+ antiporter, TMEM165/GDT1 family
VAEGAFEAFLVSTGVVALAEIGDKTQLLSLVLAARFRRPWPIVLGIVLATLVNHAFAGAAGAWVASLVGATVLRWALALSFVAMGAWALLPDRLDEQDVRAGHTGVFATTCMSFFLVEMGDKTQIATVALAARFPALAAVVAGTTLGMVIANAPVVFLGDRLTGKVPLGLVRAVAAATFVLLGVLVLLASPV